MLANILPGLRELRAPLSAGYLWIALIWLLAAPYVPHISDARGLPRRILELADDLHAVGGGVVVSFAAYLIGAVSQAIIDPVLKRVPTTRRGPGAGASRRVSAKAFRSVTQLVEDRVGIVAGFLEQHGRTLEEVAEQEYRKDVLARAGLTEKEVEQAAETRRLMNERGVSTFDLLLIEQVETILEIPRAVEAKLHLEIFDVVSTAGITVEEIMSRFWGRRAGESLDAWNARRDAFSRKLDALGVDEHRALMAAEALRALERAGMGLEKVRRAISVAERLEGIDLTLESVDFADDVEQRMESAADRAAYWETPALITKVIEDLDLVATRLIGKESELFSAVDRLRAEAEFRLAIVVPLAALATLFGAELNSYWYAAIVLPAILLVDGNRRDRAGRDLVVDALLLRRVEAPVLERFEQSAKDVVARRDAASEEKSVSSTKIRSDLV